MKKNLAVLLAVLILAAMNCAFASEPFYPELVTEHPTELSSDPGDFTLRINGGVVQLPCRIEDFFNITGLTRGDGSEQYLNAMISPVTQSGSYGGPVKLPGTEESILINFYNPEAEPIMYKDCILVGISDSHGSEHIPVEIAGGLVIHGCVMAQDFMDFYSGSETSYEIEKYGESSYVFVYEKGEYDFDDMGWAFSVNYDDGDE